MMRYCICFLMLVLMHQISYAQGVLIKGVVRDSIGNAIAKVTISEQAGSRATVSDNKGMFELQSTSSSGTLVFQHVGYNKAVKSFSAEGNMLEVIMYSSIVAVEEIVVSTGYQNVPKERATGSFEVIDERMLQTRTGGNIIERLDGLAPGLQFDKRTGNSRLNIRGINSLSVGMMDPLIILDNFPYQGDISNINPNDIASVTLLKDAAAASIWGSRAGNGVIVITSKKAVAGQKTSLDYSSTFNSSEKLDLFYNPAISSADFIHVEQFLFGKGHYDAAYYGADRTKKNTVFSPVVDMLFKVKEGKMGDSELQEAIDRYSGIDFRGQMSDIFYRRPFTQQHHLALNTSSSGITNRFTLGYDRSMGNQVGAKDNRLNLRSVNRFEITKKLSVETRLSYTNYQSFSNSGIINYNYSVGGGKIRLYPYAEFRDGDNNSLVIPRGYNMEYVEGLQGSQLLDWLYNPIEDMDKTISNGSRHHFQGQLALDYKPFDGFSVNFLYNKEYEPYDRHTLYRQDSYYARNLINRFTQIDGQNIKYILPLGGMKNSSDQSTSAYNVRAQVNYQKKFSELHDFNVLLGAEVSDRGTQTRSFRVFGYDEDLMSSQVIDPINLYPIYDGLSPNTRLPESASGYSSATQRFVSAFFNLGYVFKDKYGWSFSTRQDASNLFGVKTNDKWNPLWSTGVSWQIHKEDFLKELRWVNQLKLRGTYGHSGNSGGAANTLPIISYGNTSSASLTREQRARISSLSNPTLRWEDVRMINLGLDYSLLGNVISGSFEVYDKKSTDLLSNDLMDITTGYETIRRNVAELKGNGIDARIAVNYSIGKLRLSSGVNFSYSKTVVKKFYGTTFFGSTYAENAGRSLDPLLDKVIFPVHSFKFAGLDPENGDPMGYLNGEVSKNYRLLLLDSVQNLEYHGTALPPYYGSFTQQISWKSLTLSCLISFKAGHYFQKNTIMYNNLFNSWNGHKDIANRWQKPGDELYTTVPSMVYPAVNDRDRFYAASSPNIISGDLIRLQDLGLDYRFSARTWGQGIRGTLFLKVNNVGLLWRANKEGIDPDFFDLPASTRYSIGISLNL